MKRSAIDDPMLDEDWLAAPKKRSRGRLVLVCLLAACTMFLAGSLVQKHYGTQTSASASGLPPGLPQGFPGNGQGIPGGLTGAPVQAPVPDTAEGADDTRGVIGTVVSIRGNTWIVEDLGGTRHNVSVDSDSDLVRESTITSKDVKSGDRVDISGTGNDEQLAAETITVR